MESLNISGYPIKLPPPQVPNYHFIPQGPLLPNLFSSSLQCTILPMVQSRGMYMPDLDLISGSTSDFSGARVHKWSQEEDRLLIDNVSLFGTKAWSQVSRIINSALHQDKPVRQGKHCRERWHNHLNPELKSNRYIETEWTLEEDLLLLKLHMELGNCWSKISAKLKGRTENSVKNRWNSIMRKHRVNVKYLKTGTKEEEILVYSKFLSGSRA